MQPPLPVSSSSDSRVVKKPPASKSARSGRETRMRPMVLASLLLLATGNLAKLSAGQPHQANSDNYQQQVTTAASQASDDDDNWPSPAANWPSEQTTASAFDSLIQIDSGELPEPAEKSSAQLLQAINQSRHIASGATPTPSPETSTSSNSEISGENKPAEEALQQATTLASAPIEETQNLIEDSPQATTTLSSLQQTESSAVPTSVPASAAPVEGLTRNRKSSENSTELEAANGQSKLVNFTATESSLAAGGARESRPSASTIDYEDFDLDYQLKLSANSTGDFLNLNKRDNEKGLLPNWSSLLRQQSHLFVPSNASWPQAGPQLESPQASSPEAGNGQQPELLPSLLTVKSTQLTSQELNKIRPHFLFYQDNYNDRDRDNPSQLEASQAYPANGDLLATASVGGSPLGPTILVLANNNNHSSSSFEAAHKNRSIISLVNGSPVVRQSLLLGSLAGGGKQQNYTGSSRLVEDPMNGMVTTIVVDNSTPTEAPAAAATTPSALVNATTSGIMRNIAGLTPVEKAGPSRDNQWHNYPQPSLHQNPLLLHHILNKPANYVSQQRLPAGSGGSGGTRPAHEPTSGGTPTPLPAGSGSSSGGGLMIIERPTLNEIEGSGIISQQPINKTQLQMQLNELRALQERQQQSASSTPLPAGMMHQPPGVSNWQTNLAKPAANQQFPGDFMSHLIGSQPGNGRPPANLPPRLAFNPNLVPYQQQRPYDYRNQVNPQSQSGLGGLFAGQATGNAMHHIFGNNLAGYNLRPVPPHFFNNRTIRPVGKQLASLFHQAPFPVRPLPAAGGLVTAPSLLHEIYAPRPAPSLQQPTSKHPTLPNVRDFLARQQSWPGVESKQEKPTVSNMSEEDMSTYVAQLAAFNSALPAANAQAASEPEEPKTMSSSASSLQLQTVDMAAPSPEALLQLALEQLRQENRSDSFQSQKQSPARSWTDLFKEAKLIGLSEEVQAQIYNEHLNPMLAGQLNKRPEAAKQATRPPYSALLSAASSEPKGSQQPKAAGSEDARSWAPAADPLTSSNLYSSIEEHRKEQAELQRVQQRRKQAAFVEALRESIARLQQAAHQNEPAPELRGNNSLNQASPEDFEENQQQQQSKPIPDWLERQIIQESFLHESARVHPFGHSTKSTFIGPNPGAFYAARPAALLRPAGSHLQPSHLARPLYPLIPIRGDRLTPLTPGFPPVAGPGGRLLTPLVPLRPAPYPYAAESKNIAQQLTGSNNLQTVPFAPLNPSKLLLDRFPMASAPAYLVKLPTLSGGTITASGSLIPPRLLRLNKQAILAGAGGLLGAAAGIPMAGRLRLMAPPQPMSQGQLQQAPSFLAPLHRPPPNFFRYPPPPNYAPAPLAYSASMQQVGFLEQPARPPFPLLAPVAYDQPNPYLQPPMQHLNSAAGAQKLQPSPSNALPQNHEQKQSPPTQQAFAGEPEAEGLQQQLPPSALTRLQQATASLVELTGLASLVEEMVSGPDIESSPAAALANAINSLSAAHAQSAAAMNAQATTTNGASTSLSGAAQTGSGFQDHAGQPQANNQQMFSWKSVLNVPAIWREKALLNKNRDAYTLERLLASAAAARQRPTTRLKVKYIKVPVAVYETVGANADISSAGLLVPPRNQLVTKTQLAELVASSGSGSASGSGEHPAAQTNNSPLSGTTTSTPTNAGSAASGSAPAASGTGGQHAESSPISATAASSSEFLFDELGSDSSPLANYLASGDLLESAEIELPAASTPVNLNRQPNRSFKKFFPLTRAPLLASDLLSPMESGFYYSMLAAPSMSQPQTSAPANSGSDQEAGSSKKSRTSKRKKKKKKKEEDEDEEEDEDDDDDLLSKDDLPLLESIISTIVQPNSPTVIQQQPSGWLRGPRMGSPFGSLSGEASTKVETYAASPMAASGSQHSSTMTSPFGKHSHRFTIGEVVGALGARKLISSLLSRKKSSPAVSRTATKRAVTRPPFSATTANPTSSGLVNQMRGSNFLPSTSTIAKSTPLSKLTNKVNPIRYPGGSIYDYRPDSKSKPSIRRKSPTMNATDDEATSTTRRDVPEVAPNTAGSKADVVLPDDVQFSFSLRDPAHEQTSKRDRKQPEEETGGGRGKQTESKNAMPLYHVVADHFSKLHSGPVSLQKTISGQQNLTSKQLATVAQPRSTTTTTTTSNPTTSN